MKYQWNTVLVTLFVTSYGAVVPESGESSNSLRSFLQDEKSGLVLSKMARDNLEAVRENMANLSEDISITAEEGQDLVEGRKRKKYKKQEIMMLTKMLMGLKVALLGIVLPLAVVTAKLLSWKAVTLSLLAFMLSKIVFVKNLVMGKSAPTTVTPTAPAPPIIIHSQSHPHSHEAIWKRASTQPRIHLQPEVHVHHSEEHHAAPSPPSWTWAEEARLAKDPHELAYDLWLTNKSD